ncbi:uncharacterized protein LOC131997246 [Stomoxys calcitrans]|uniref:uncharacterized protein LOC131997246 n=1 Tax=Stomoxys calcitrans TaxID=35570 RepID=UPI0027E33495|nr:uncharacterized protein LOC131997246 [Stomoxys calcitrans]
MCLLLIDFLESVPTFLGDEFVHIKVHVPKKVPISSPPHNPNNGHKVSRHYHGHKKPNKPPSHFDTGPLLENIILSELDHPNIAPTGNAEEEKNVKINTFTVIEETDSSYKTPTTGHGGDHLETLLIREQKDRPHDVTIKVLGNTHGHHSKYKNNRPHEEIIKVVHDDHHHHHHHHDSDANEEYEDEVHDHHDPWKETFKGVKANNYRDPEETKDSRHKHHRHQHKYQIEDITTDGDSDDYNDSEDLEDHHHHSSHDHRSKHRNSHGKYSYKRPHHHSTNPQYDYSPPSKNKESFLLEPKVYPRHKTRSRPFYTNIDKYHSSVEPHNVGYRQSSPTYVDNVDWNHDGEYRRPLPQYSRYAEYVTRDTFQNANQIYRPDFSPPAVGDRWKQQFAGPPENEDVELFPYNTQNTLTGYANQGRPSYGYPPTRQSPISYSDRPYLQTDHFEPPPPPPINNAPILHSTLPPPPPPPALPVHQNTLFDDLPPEIPPNHKSAPNIDWPEGMGKPNNSEIYSGPDSYSAEHVQGLNSGGYLFDSSYH